MELVMLIIIYVCPFLITRYIFGWLAFDKHDKGYFAWRKQRKEEKRIRKTQTVEILKQLR